MCFFVSPPQYISWITCFLGATDAPQETPPAKKQIYKISTDKLDLIKGDTTNQKIWDDILSSYETITVGAQ